MPEEAAKKGATVAQTIGTAISLLGVIILFYTQTQVRLNALELQMSEKEKQDQLFIDQFHELGVKLDKIQLEIYDVKIELQKKADKKE